MDGLRNTSFQLEALEKENAQLDEENLELRRAAENLRSAGAKAAQLEMENRELESERSQLKRSMELLKASSKKTERLEVRMNIMLIVGNGLTILARLQIGKNLAQKRPVLIPLIRHPPLSRLG